MDNTWLTAGLWMGLALVASLFSVRWGVSIALTEILVGGIGGNFLGLKPTPWITFLGGFGSIVLTFLAGADIDPGTLRKRTEGWPLKPTANRSFPPTFSAW